MSNSSGPSAEPVAQLVHHLNKIKFEVNPGTPPPPPPRIPTSDDHRNKAKNVLHWGGLLEKLLWSKGLQGVVRKLEEKQLVTKIESPTTAKELINERGLFSSTDYITSDLERLIFDSFLEDGDNDLHMLTLRSLENPSFAQGAIFWRDLSSRDMREWIIPDNLHPSTIEGIVNDHDHKWEIIRRKLVQHHADEPSEALFDHWVKIELVVTHTSYMGQRIGTLMMVLALYHASTVLDKREQTGRSRHALLHAAGGEENVAAVSLYKRLGFHPSPTNMFSKPCKNMYILPHISESLAHMDWATVLGQSNLKRMV